MAISKKGLRKIVVEEQVFYWRFNKQIYVFKEEAENSLLIVDFGYYDLWLHVNDEQKPPDFEPKIVTPKFVRESILFALNHGWTNGTCELVFQDNRYEQVSAN